MTRAAKKALRRSRAAQQAINYSVNKYVRELTNALEISEAEKERLQQELKETKKELKQTLNKLKQTKKISNQTVKNTLHTIKFQPNFKKLVFKAYTRGSFDSYGYTKGWRYSAQKAGNRLENDHPGFYAAMKEVESKGGDPLEMIIKYYNIEMHKAVIYEADIGYTFDQDYQLLGYACYELYKVILPGYTGPIDDLQRQGRDANIAAFAQSQGISYEEALAWTQVYGSGLTTSAAKEEASNVADALRGMDWSKLTQ